MDLKSTPSPEVEFLYDLSKEEFLRPFSEKSIHCFCGVVRQLNNGEVHTSLAHRCQQGNQLNADPLLSARSDH